MPLRGEDRGQAVQVGAVLLLGILVLALALVQVSVVPDDNRQQEFDNYLTASGEMQRLHDDIRASAGRDVQAGTTVTTGLRYPSRAVFVNPPPPTGTVRTGPVTTVSLDGVRAAEGEAPNTRRYWNGSERSYDDRFVVFRPDYNELDAPPVVTTGRAVYRAADGGPVAVTGQSLVSGDRITVVTVAGDLQATGTGASVITEPVSAATRTVTVTGEDATFNLTLTTPGNASTWLDSGAADQLRANDNVESVTAVPGTENRVNVTFDGSETYRLRTARVEVRERGDDGTGVETSPHYVVRAGGDNRSIGADQVAELTVEVRDRFNNPKPGAEVTFAAGNGSFVGDRRVTTNDRGRATVQFKPGRTGALTVDAGRDRDGDGQIADENALDRTSFTVQVTTAGSLGGEDDPATTSGDAAGVVVFQQDVETTALERDTVNVTFTLGNRASRPVNITGYRVSYIAKQEPGGGQGGGSGVLKDGPDKSEGVTLREADGTFIASDGRPVEQGGEAVFFDDGEFTLRAETSHEYDLRLNEEVDTSNPDTVLLISITLYFEDGFSGRYDGFIFE